MQHLYLLQNHLGLIKVGRSVNVELRRRRLEKADNCRIEIVAILRDAGKYEERLHKILRQHRLYGEWYGGDRKVLKKSSAFFGIRRKVSWPFPLAEDDSIDLWLEQLEESRSLETADKLLQSCIRAMANGWWSDPHEYRRYDAHIWFSLIRFEHRVDVMCIEEEGPDGQWDRWSYCPVRDERVVVPYYTSQLQAALSLWPDEQRPKTWDRTIWECCVEGLKARKAFIKRTR